MKTTNQQFRIASQALQVIVQQLHDMQPLDALQAQRLQTIGVVDDVPRAPVPYLDVPGS